MEHFTYCSYEAEMAAFAAEEQEEDEVLILAPFLSKLCRSPRERKERD
jgi:hypothetical protein